MKRQGQRVFVDSGAWIALALTRDPLHDRPDLFRLSAVDATSFTLMKRHRIRVAFAFDHHFGTVGFRMVG